jgi:hypothetical protein
MRWRSLLRRDEPRLPLPHPLAGPAVGLHEDAWLERPNGLQTVSEPKSASSPIQNATALSRMPSLMDFEVRSIVTGREPKPASCRSAGGSVLGSTRAATGAPQPGQLAASVETWREHSGQEISAMSAVVAAYFGRAQRTHAPQFWISESRP